jgi:hypothetical protein
MHSTSEVEFIKKNDEEDERPFRFEELEDKSVYTHNTRSL